MCGTDLQLAEWCSKLEFGACNFQASFHALQVDCTMSVNGYLPFCILIHLSGKIALFTFDFAFRISPRPDTCALAC